MGHGKNNLGADHGSESETSKPVAAESESLMAWAGVQTKMGVTPGARNQNHGNSPAEGDARFKGPPKETQGPEGEEISSSGSDLLPI